MPPLATGPRPDMALKYSSQSVDGQMASSNNQPGWIGEGFSYHPGSITRSYKACADDMGGTATNKTKTGDLCFGSWNATLSMPGHSGELIRDDTDGHYSLKDDDGSKVERLTGATNGANGGEYWKITTSDGTQYFFGLNRIAGWATGNPTTNSAFTVPVFGNNPGEPCYNATFASAACNQAWQWNLDYVVDTHAEHDVAVVHPGDRQVCQEPDQQLDRVVHARRLPDPNRLRHRPAHVGQGQRPVHHQGSLQGRLCRSGPLRDPRVHLYLEHTEQLAGCAVGSELHVDHFMH
nr:hypothetical protein GCM10020092_078120 [Actinoplanes digitatis]